MLEYYTEESIEKYGAFALVIELIWQTNEKKKKQDFAI